MRLSFRKKLLMGFIATIALLIAFSIMALRAIRELNSSHDWVIHTQLVLRKTNLATVELSNIEENYGQYIITGNETSLRDFEVAATSSKQSIKNLEALVSDNPMQKNNIEYLYQLSIKRIADLRNVIEFRKKHNLVATEEYIRQFLDDSKRGLSKRASANIAQIERRLLVKRMNRSENSSYWAIGSLALCTVFGVTFIIFLYRLIWKTFRQKQRVEESLKISEHTFSTAFHNSGIGIALVSPEGKWMNVNLSLCSMLGYSREEFIQLTFQDITFPNDLEMDLENVERVLDGEIDGYSLEKRYIHKQGNIIWALLHVSLVKDKENKPQFFISQVIDISERKRTASENQQILNSSMDVICSIDAEGNFSRVSKASRWVWGYEPEELIGKAYMDLVVEEDKALTTGIAQQIMSGVPVTNFQNHYRCKDGSIVPVIWSAVYSEEEKTMFCVARDGSEKAILEKALENEKQRFESLFLQAPSCIAVLEGQELIFKTANPLYLEVHGKQDIVGRPIKEVFPEFEAQEIFELLEQAFESGNSYSRKECRARLLKNGSDQFTDTYFDLVYQPYKNEKDKIAGIFLFANDVTQKVIARTKIEENEKLYRQLIDEMPGAVYSCNAEGYITLYNKAAIELWGREPVIGKELWSGAAQIYDKNGNLLPLDETPIARTVKTGELVRDDEFVIAKPNGELRDVQPHPFPLYSNDGKLLGAIDMLVDITPHKKAEETLLIQQQALQNINRKLSEKNKAIEEARREVMKKAAELELTSKYKSEFLANMSHELRTPLNAVLVLANLLSENTPKNLTPKQVEYADIIQKSGTDLLNLINDILDLAKIEAGKLNLAFGNTSVAAIIKDVERLFAVMAKGKNIAFEVKVSDNVPQQVHTDKLRLEQIIKNLLSNAFKFTAEGGSIKLRLDFEENHLVFKVKDTGIGIEDDKKQIIFEAFQQANGTTTRKFGGTGLGLSISKELAQKFGGVIELESEYGKGCLFTVRIPYIEASEKTEPVKTVVEIEQPASIAVPKHASAEPKAQAAFKGKKLLVVDDDVRNIYAISSMLEEQGIDFYTATNGVEAIEQLNNCNDIDLVLMDMMMPEMDGYEAMRIIRQEERFEKLPIIALTAKAMVGDAEQCIQAGASDYITKPFNNQHLTSQISYWFTRKND